MKKKCERSSVSSIGFYKLFWVFMVGCVIGVAIEVFFSFVTTGRIVNPQGVIYGPFNPVYGFGVVFLTLLLYPVFNKQWYIIFILSMVVGGGFEFLISYLQQFSTGTVSWQYQQLPLNLYGRTSLIFSFYWGVLGFLWIKKIDPSISMVIAKPPKKMGLIITWILIVFMIFNLTISLLAVDRWEQRINNIPANGAVGVFLDKTYPNSVLEKIYPEMTHLGHT
ncbi:putative ABC transporter permease [Acetobacterium sp.]|uniref:putative ABC transporter permease n=1 Tax=Acetobacterium sp. TaxID=1872094 RepID=UPI002F3FD07E